MKIDIGLLLSLFAVLVNFGTILSYYWKMSERILNAENRISNIENNK